MAWDTWAFLETYYGGPRAEDVDALAAEAEAVFTVREVVAETFNAVVKDSGRTQDGWAWWQAVRESRVRVFEPPLEELWAFMGARKRVGALSFTDHALAHIALREGVDEVATEDAEFRRFGLRPLFSRR